jgi:hypothetical protein
MPVSQSRSTITPADQDTYRQGPAMDGASPVSLQLVPLYLLLSLRMPYQCRVFAVIIPRLLLIECVAASVPDPLLAQLGRVVCSRRADTPNYF